MAIKSSLPVVYPTLNLNFAARRRLDPRITFTRASTGSYYDGDGYLKLAASGSARFDHDPATGESKGLLIEEQRTNLLTYSESFDNAAWTKGRSSITANATVAPDGTTTADKLVEDTTASNTHVITQNSSASSTVNTNPITVSAYFKAAERTIVAILLVEGTTYGRNAIAYFDLNAATATTPTVTGGASAASATITSVGNGWYRCALTVTLGGTDTRAEARYYSATSTTSNTYTGDGTSGVYIWGAQLEAGAFPTSYIPSADSFTSRASTATYIGSNGLIQSASTNVARYNYNPLNLTLAPKLLLEEQRTNLLTYSEQFDNAAWNKIRSSVTANAVSAPDGTTSAEKLVEDTTAANTHYVFQSFTQAASATTYTASVFAKAGERAFLRMSFQSGTFANLGYSVFDLSTGSISSSSGATATVTPVGGGWYRCTNTWTSNTETSQRFELIVQTTSGSINHTGDGTSGLYIWGAQLEAGSYPTSYIPTTTAQVTRSADLSSSSSATRSADVASMTGTNFSSWYNQTEGTFVAGFDAPNTETSTRFVVGASDGTISELVVIGKASSNRATCEVYDGGAAQYAISSAVGNLVSTVGKCALAYKANDFASSTNGLLDGTDTSGALPTVTQLNIGDRATGGRYLNGHIARLTYYPKRLSNTELQQLSS